MLGLGLRLGKRFITGTSPSFVGPLDNYAANLSVMLLPFRGLSSHTGNAFKVRDTIGDAEQDIGFDPISGAPLSAIVAGDAAISWWYDQSGNSYNAVNAAATQQPLLVENIVNSLPIARFDGSNDSLSTPTIPAEAAKTVYVVAKKRSAATGVAARGVVVAGSLGYTILDCNLGSGQWTWAYDNSDTNPATLGGSVQSWSLVALTLTTVEAEAWVNNVAGSAFVPSSDFIEAGTVLLGSGEATVDIDIAGILIYSEVHNDATRQAIQTILANKFDIALA